MGKGKREGRTKWRQEGDRVGEDAQMRELDNSPQKIGYPSIIHPPPRQGFPGVSSSSFLNAEKRQTHTQVIPQTQENAQ